MASSSNPKWFCVVSGFNGSFRCYLDYNIYVVKQGTFSVKSLYGYVAQPTTCSHMQRGLLLAVTLAQEITDVTQNQDGHLCKTAAIIKE